MQMAAGPWTKVQRLPEPSRSYLICATFGGVQTCDVAFYNGHAPMDRIGGRSAMSR